MMNEWDVLDDFQADQVLDMEEWLDCICAFVNLRTLCRLGRLDDIPEDEPRGFAHRNFSKVEYDGLTSVKFAPDLPAHLLKLLEDGPNFAGRIWEASFRPTPLERALSRVNSCYVLQINCCELSGGRFII
jgi:hypothetical protein